MKKRLYLITTMIASVAALTFSSCLKDSRYYTFSNVGALVELPLAAYNGLGNLTPEALPVQSTPQTVPVVVNIASPQPLSAPVTVTLAVDQSALDAYNTANSTNYIIPPSSAYSISSLQVTIPAGQRQGRINVTVTTSNFDLTAQYVIPLTITNGGGQKISNYKTILLNVQAKNQYDGIYSLKGYIHRGTDLTLGGPFAPGITIPMATAGANSVSFSQVWATGSETGGVNPIIATVDPTTNAVTITSLANPSLGNLSGYNSHYDPNSKTFYLGFIWNGTDPNHRSTIDTLTYVGSR